MTSPIPPGKPEFEIPLEDVENDHLIEKANALMQRHQGFAANAPDADDLPILTDIVEDAPPALEERIEPFIDAASPIIVEPFSNEPEALDELPLLEDDVEELTPLAPVEVAAAPSLPLAELDQRLAAMEAAISRQLEDWVANELPQLVSRELDELSERLREKAAAHLRSTLLPAVSAEISARFDDASEA